VGENVESPMPKRAISGGISRSTRLRPSPRGGAAWGHGRTASSSQPTIEYGPWREKCTPGWPELCELVQNFTERARAQARKVLGWPRRCKLAHAFLWEYSYKRLKLAQLLANRWRLSHLIDEWADEPEPVRDRPRLRELLRAPAGCAPVEGEVLVEQYGVRSSLVHPLFHF
jgi:hypothetical protein